MKAALQFLTVLPVRGGQGYGASWFPLVGCLLGLGAALALRLPQGAVLALLLVTTITGGLHEDGLADVCDAVETCSGASNSCPTDGVLGTATTCRTAAGICDQAENCTGSSIACPADAKSTAVCRAAAGVCDSAETCDGATDACPTDVAASTATVSYPFVSNLNSVRFVSGLGCLPGRSLPVT